MSSFIDACKDGKVDTVKDLINDGEEIDQTDDLGQTGLMWAIRKGHASIVELLCDSNADVAHESQAGTVMEI
eukprot:CAMPEP_0197528816 /NCGR_PEP_ID=MMETSP1318-20131121/26440_1 /TAXON_ID=552666 /ORGANISM="Partenskyella glossopodia, Strain RCC365" /LENGTH=71 /DNA_ID=CAMNT_0043084061 /DNA_START=82 /DNA_END=294 /DNA_ORIENTATION=+